MEANKKLFNTECSNCCAKGSKGGGCILNFFSRNTVTKEGDVQHKGIQKATELILYCHEQMRPKSKDEKKVFLKQQFEIQKAKDSQSRNEWVVNQYFNIKSVSPAVGNIEVPVCRATWAFLYGFNTSAMDVGSKRFKAGQSINPPRDFNDKTLQSFTYEETKEIYKSNDIDFGIIIITNIN